MTPPETGHTKLGTGNATSVSKLGQFHEVTMPRSYPTLF
jgi:hypothetical protein